MSKENAIYPFRHMNITQRHDQGNHVPHHKGSKNYSDKPWDEACKDGGRSYFEPQNDFKVEEVIGLGNNITNSVRLVSVNKLTMPNGKTDYLKLTLTHMEESNLKQVKKGQILKKGTKLLLEGKDGYSTGNHFHITANTGKYYGLLQNSNGAWCYTYEKSLLPDEAFYLDSSWTKVINARSYNFKQMPKKESVGTIVARDQNKNQIEVKVSDLNCRKTAKKSGAEVGFAKKGIHNYTDKATADGYDWYKISAGWIAYTSEWCNLYPKKVVESPKAEEKPKVEEQKVEEKPKLEEKVAEEIKVTDKKQEETTKSNVVMNLINTIIDLIKELLGKNKK